jgi:excinuclease ABC subunit A
VEQEFIEIVGAKEHNLKGITVRIPKRRLVVFSGVSGSGKSSLAFDTLYAEGQRRYVESLSAYARQFLGQLEKPKYEAIHGLTPTIAIEQKSASSNPRSTVGTTTEIHDYLRVLFARVGEQFCHVCGRRVEAREAGEIVRDILALRSRLDTMKVLLLAPVVKGRKGEFRDLLASLLSQGFVRIRIDGEIREIQGCPPLDKNKKHDIEVVIDRISLREGIEQRLVDSVETALKVGKGRLLALLEDGREIFFSEHLACEYCGISFPELSPQLFSFNNPIGACPSCKGLGTALDVDISKVIDEEVSLRDGAIQPASVVLGGEEYTSELLRFLSKRHGIDLSKKFCDLPEEHKRILLYGEAQSLQTSQYGGGFVFEGIANIILRRLRETRSFEMRLFYQQFLTDRPCDACNGRRLRPEALAVKVGGYGIGEMSEMSVSTLRKVILSLSFSDHRALVANELIKEIASRLKLLEDLGVGYLTLARQASTLSGGEAERIRLASQIGSELTGVTYVLDEPSIGLHPRDNFKLIGTLRRLRDLGNTVVVVEHDKDTIMSADHVIEFGPGAGRHGGEVIFEGPPSIMLNAQHSLTGQYFSGRLCIPIPKKRRAPKGFFSLVGASGHNLKNITCRFPLGNFIVVTGVSGAGKSSLVTETLFPALQKHLGYKTSPPLPYERLEGADQIDKVVLVDQEPIGRTPRSNPATYTKVFDYIRALFASTKEARVYGYKPGRFSFNVRGGRCEKCEGAGVLKVEMHFLPDVFVTCDECKGKRFNEATLRVKYKGYSIAEVLEMTVDEAMDVFSNHRPIVRILKTLKDVGLGYITLGQPSPTLSGGEAQRIKLSRELARVATGRTLYVMDEPSTGLHVADVKNLLEVVNRLTDMGNTVIMIEHNLEIVKTADYIIDLGPEGGDEGGYVVAWGTPEEVANSETHTGKWLRKVLAGE